MTSGQSGYSCCIFERLRRKKCPWINSILIHQFCEADSLQKRFDKTPSDQIRSGLATGKLVVKVNNLIKKTKRDSFVTCINSAKNDREKTDQLISKLSSRKVNHSTNVKFIKQDGV